VLHKGTLNSLIYCAYLILTARETLPNQFALESNALLDCKTIKVFAKASLALLVDHECKLDHPKCNQAAITTYLIRLIICTITQFNGDHPSDDHKDSSLLHILGLRRAQIFLDKRRRHSLRNFTAKPICNLHQSSRNFRFSSLPILADKLDRFCMGRLANRYSLARVRAYKDALSQKHETTALYYVSILPAPDACLRTHGRQLGLLAKLTRSRSFCFCEYVLSQDLAKHPAIHSNRKTE